MHIDYYRLVFLILLATGGLGMLLNGRGMFRLTQRLRSVAMLCLVIGGAGAMATPLIEERSADAHATVDATYQFVATQMRSCRGEGFFFGPTTQECKSRVYVIVDHSSLDPQERAKADQIITQW
jgi:hypothetical protein